MTRNTEGVILLEKDEGRRYGMRNLTAIFKADEAETGWRYAVSEWLLDPGFDGVGPHSHQANEELFHVLEGEPEILIGNVWTLAARGTFLRIPAGTMHDFRNLRPARARLLNVFIPGGFEPLMPDIVSWFANDARQKDHEPPQNAE